MELLQMRGSKLFSILLVMLISPIFLTAADSLVEQSITISSAYYFPDNKGFDLSGNFAPITYLPVLALSDTERDLGSTWGGVELKGTYKLSNTHNFLTGGSALTEGNNLRERFIFDISPVNFEIGGDLTLTPIAFLNFNAGTTVAAAWTAIGIAGLGLNYPSGIVQDAFQGVLSRTWLSGTFQFDTAAILSGDTTWKHIIILTSHTLTYKNFSAATADAPWSFQGSEGDKYNGFTYGTTSVLAYQMPLVLDMAGLLVETTTNLFDNAERSTIADGGWGSDFIKVTFGGLLNFKFNDKHSLAILPQFSIKPHYTDETVTASYFENREIDTNSPIFYDFDRIAIAYTYNF